MRVSRLLGSIAHPYPHDGIPDTSQFKAPDPVRIGNMRSHRPWSGFRALCLRDAIALKWRVRSAQRSEGQSRNETLRIKHN
jgi:hypothetical protein